MTKLNTTRLNELPIKTILDDDDYVVISGRGTKKIKAKDITKDVEMKAADLEEKIKNNREQLDTIANDVDVNKSCIYNIQALKNIYNKSIKAIAFGDSILHGTGSDNGGAYGFIQMTQNTLSSINAPNFYKRLITMPTLTTDWISTNDGISNYLKYTTKGNLKLGELGKGNALPPIDYVFNIVYSTREDGGNCEVYKGDVLLDTFSCKGTKKDGLIKSYKIPAKTKCYIKTIEGEKLYLNDMYSYADLDRGHRLTYHAVGGSKTSDYSKQVFYDAMEGFNGNLLIWEYLANDYGNNNYDNYVSYTTDVITKAKSLGMDVILTITCGQGSTDTTNLELWNKYKSFIYNIAKEKRCCVIDYDKLFGGNTLAVKNGLLADGIHPTTPGYLLMANELCKVLVSVNCLEFDGLALELGDYREKGFGFIKRTKFNNIDDLKVTNLSIKVGNPYEFYNYLPPSVSFISNNHRYPSYLPTGNLMLNDVSLRKLVCNIGGSTASTRDIQPVWASPQMEVVTSLPTNQDNNIGKFFIYDDGTENHKIVTYIKYVKSDGNIGRKWVVIPCNDFIV